MILDRGWWHTADKTRLVPDGHPDAAILAYPWHSEIPDDTARRLGILKDPEPEPEPASGDAGEDEEPVEAKMAAKPANKARKATA